MSINKGINFPEYLQEKIASIRAKSTDIDNIYVSVIQDTNFDMFLKEWYTNIEKTPMSEYWLSFMYMVEILIMNIHSVKLGIYLKTLGDSWFLGFKFVIKSIMESGCHYGKWLPDFWAEISNLNE